MTNRETGHRDGSQPFERGTKAEKSETSMVS